MKIEKKKVTGNSRLSSATKAGVASLLGLSTVLMTGCLGDAESGQVVGPVEPDNNNPNSSDDSETPEIQSSSSVVDIPLSHEHLSSEAIEALSSASQPRSSSSTEPLSGTPMIVSSSSVEKPSSSSMEQPPEAGILPPYEESSSSVAPSSSSMEILEPLAGDPIVTESSSSESTPDAQSSSSDIKVPVPQITPVIDTLNPRIHLCEDPNNPGCLIESMVTTFEQSDIQV